MTHRLRIEGSDLAAGQEWTQPAAPGWGWRIVAAGPAMVTAERIAPDGPTGRRERRKRYRMANTLRLFGAVLAN